MRCDIFLHAKPVFKLPHISKHCGRSFYMFSFNPIASCMAIIWWEFYPTALSQATEFSITEGQVKFNFFLCFLTRPVIIGVGGGKYPGCHAENTKANGEYLSWDISAALLHGTSNFLMVELPHFGIWLLAYSLPFVDDIPFPKGKIR